MRQIERFNLIDRIGRELQSRMTYTDIDVYLSGFGVEPGTGEHSYNSKWIYTKERLASATVETIIRIADELELDHPYVIAYQGVSESRFWEPGHFRLFLSHLSAFKATAGALQRVLRPYGITVFVAHVDIEPAKEWQGEIEAALFSMDALVAVLMKGFKESNWTDQEVGVAIGRGVLVIPVIKDLDPYGFVGKYQGFSARGKSVAEVARAMFSILIQSPRTRARMLSALVDTAIVDDVESSALVKIEILSTIDDIPAAYLQRFRDGILSNAQHTEGSAVWRGADALLKARGQATLSSSKAGADPFGANDDELPF